MFKGLLPEQIMESIKDKNSSCTHTGQGSGEQLLKGLMGRKPFCQVKSLPQQISHAACDKKRKKLGNRCWKGAPQTIYLFRKTWGNYDA